MGQKPLSWQQIAAVLICVFAMFPAAILAWGGDITPEWRARGLIAFWIILAIDIGLLFWHFLTVNRADLVPDLLAQLVAPREILQLGPMHLWLVALQAGGRLRVLVVTQNTRGGEGEIRLRLQPHRKRVVFLTEIPPLEARVAGAAVNVATIDLALQPVSKPIQIWLWVEGAAGGAGQTMRFARRKAVTKRTSGWITLLALLGGHLHAGGGTYVTISVAPFDPRTQLAAGPPPVWNVWPLWTPEQPMDVREMAEEIQRLLGRGMSV